MNSVCLGRRRIAPDEPPLVIAEIGINHEGDLGKALRMVDDAADAGCECVKFQCHVIEDEMIPNDVVPGNATESIWDIMSRAALDAEQDRRLKEHVERRGMIYLCTPFSRAAADRLQAMDVAAYKIGSGECNNYPLVRHIAAFGRPVILSTGMNNVASIRPAVGILREAGVPFALMHCTSLYPTPYEKVRLGAMAELAEAFPDAVLGLSDHSLGNYTCYGAVALGACLVEKHFTSDRAWPGPDIPISITPPELRNLVAGTRAIWAARGGEKTILPDEQPTIDFAYASVVSTVDIAAGAVLDRGNIWVKRPGTGELRAAEYEGLLGCIAVRDIPANTPLRRADIRRLALASLPAVRSDSPARGLKPRRGRDATKRLLFITGTRADFGKLKPLMEQVERSADFENHIFVTGMHTLSRYGFTFDEVKKCGFRNIFTYLNQVAHASSDMDLVLANTVSGLGHYIREFPPDLIVVHGDRVEALAGAVVGSLNDILVAHLEGGELSGTVDELIRHAISKLSHIHCVANEEARDRLVQMGETPDSVFVTGSADVDLMLSDRLPTLDRVRARYEIPFADYGLLLYHPVTTELDRLTRHAEQVVAAVQESGWNFIVIYPNNDRGSETILEALRRLEGHPRFRVTPSVRFEYFLTLLKHARVIVGNSSAGVREAPVYGVPTVNLGTRQMNRYDYPSIVNVAESKDAILAALRQLPTNIAPSWHFGRGDSAERFMAALRGSRFWRTPQQKQFRDLPILALVDAARGGEDRGEPSPRRARAERVRPERRSPRPVSAGSH